MSNYLNLTKTESDNLLNLRKDNILNLVKSSKLPDGHKARVILVLDASGSMSSLYNNGSVQAVIDKVLPVALEFDDDGQLEVKAFSRGVQSLPNVTTSNYYGYVDSVSNSLEMSITNYAPVIDQIVSEAPTDQYTYVIFITDGDNHDKPETTNAIKHASNYPIFWQFVGLGNTSFSYLEKLDDMDGRYVDNADFFQVPEAVSIYGEEFDFYNKLLNEYPEWVNYPEVKSIISGQHVPPKATKKKGFLSKLFG